jgi:hypothetical protein
VVNKSINSRPGENIVQKSPYEIYYGKEAQSISYMLDSDILKHAKTEYGLTTAELLLNKVAEVDKDIMVEVEEIQRAIQGGDEAHEQEVKLKILAKRTNYYDGYDSFSADDLVEKLVIELVKEVTNRHYSDESNKKPSGTMKGKRKREASSSLPMEDSPNRKKIRMQVMESKKKEAVKVNTMRKKKVNAEQFKDPLEIGDIGTISTDDLKSKYFPYLPVLITGIVKVITQTNTL